jgi:hypothetical protein
MKNTFTKLLSGALLASLGLSSAALCEDVIVTSNFVHIPKGFDGNDKDVQVVVTGDLPNTCYRRPYGETKIVGDKIKIDVLATKLNDKNLVCIQAVVPYMITVQLGQLAEGNYAVQVNPGTDSSQEALLNIEKPSSSSIDNFTYANVSSVKHNGKNPYVTLEGFHPSSCMVIERVDMISNKDNDTFSLLPIIKQAAPECDRMIKPFSVDVALPLFSQKEALVHVRKLDGHALNVLVHQNGDVKAAQ